MHCCFCKKQQSANIKFIMSPSESERAYICEECVPVCIDAMNQSDASNAEAPCSFCYKGAETVRTFSSSGKAPNATLCEECLAVCMAILEDDSPATGE